MGKCVKKDTPSHEILIFYHAENTFPIHHYYAISTIPPLSKEVRRRGTLPVYLEGYSFNMSKSDCIVLPCVVR
jgi:hypothetical protein